MACLPSVLLQSTFCDDVVTVGECVPRCFVTVFVCNRMRGVRGILVERGRHPDDKERPCHSDAGLDWQSPRSCLPLPRVTSPIILVALLDMQLTTYSDHTSHLQRRSSKHAISP